MKNKLSFSIFVYFFILVFLSLGTWQIVRLNWNLDLINSIDQSFKSDPDRFYGGFYVGGVPTKPMKPQRLKKGGLAKPKVKPKRMKKGGLASSRKK